MNVLSLFDGYAGARVALDRAGFKVNNYFASEVDKYAIKVSSKNFPDIQHLGDVTKIDFSKLPKIDLLIGGSPCQGFSIAGKGLNFQDERSRLFFEYVKALKTLKPKYFVLENVKMKKEWQDKISEIVGVQPIEINSALVSEQNRKRLYWTNIPNITQPKLKRNKCYVIDCGDGFPSSAGVDRVYKRKAIFNTLTARYSSGINGASRPAISKKEGYYYDDKTLHRQLTPIECERLQTLPDNYTEGVSNPQRYKMLGNGFTVDIIAHILSFMQI